MSKKILIVEDESIVAYDLKLILTRAGYKVCGIAASVPKALEIIEEQKPEMVLLDIYLKGPQSGIDLAKILTVKNIGFVYLSANFQESVLEKAKATQPYGFLVKPFREKDLLIALDVAFYRHQNSMESKLRQEQALDEVFRKTIAEPITPEQKLLKISRSLQPHVSFDFITVTAKDGDESPFDNISFLRTGFDEYQVIGTSEFMNITRLNADELKKLHGANPLHTKADFFNGNDFYEVWQQYPLKKIVAKTFQMQSILLYPILLSNGNILTFSFYSRKADCYSPDQLTLLSRIQRSLIMAMEGIVVTGNIRYPTNKPHDHFKNGNTEKDKASEFEGIIGKSHQMLTVLDHVSIVAPLDASVLILGESGTGKERIAKSIHNLSPRNNKSLVIVNCASLPSNLIESELFGHEKGAFTGAFERRIGKFELADKGTIFLDEIGEMPAELQVKLLRVLQEQEIERIGGKAPIKINVRIIAATNRNLEKEMEEGRFRLDLYYRLYVFPILIPALRERKDDIPVLVNHFIEQYSRKTGKKITGLAPDILKQLMDYHWPGNVRELEHFIERSILLSNGNVIKEAILPRSAKRENYAKPEETGMKTIDENERDHILAVLKKCEGKIGGKNGAAEILGLPPTTLHSKIKKFGIKKDHQ